MLKAPDEFTRSYIECALWSTNDESTPEGGEPLDDNYGPEDLSQECLAAMIVDCESFQEDNARDLTTWSGAAPWTADAMGGHDFWLTRNGHGAGFWDGDWEEKVGDRLTAASTAYGEVHLHVGDDNLIHSLN